MSSIRLLIITSCTGEKKFNPEGSLTLEDFQNKERLIIRTKQLEGYSSPAGLLYTGSQHLHVLSGVKTLREVFGQENVDLMILSAGYGLISEDKMIVPYEVTFNNLKSGELDKWAKVLNIRDDFEKAIVNYDLVFILLGERYLRSLALPVVTNPEQTLIFLASGKSDRYIPPLSAKIFKILLSNDEARQFSFPLVGLKGYLLERFTQNIKELPQYLEKVYRYPEFFKSVIYQNPEPLQLSLPIQVAEVPKKISPSKSVKLPLDLTQIEKAANSHYSLQYYIPEYDDLVDPKYDFLTDSYDKNRDGYFDQVYAHEIYGSPNYDGVLISKVVIEGKTKKKALMREMGVGNYVRFPRKNIMGDCGAFGYISEEVPPYKTEDILEFYDQLGFDYGVSIDHLIVGPFAQPGVREQRYELTMKNAEDFLRLHRERGYQFTPIGAVQGWSPESYAEAVKEYIKMGYDYIGLGGMVRSSNEVIFEVLKAVSPHLTSQTRVHLFGVARLESVEAFHHLGVTSMDSASPLRKAWLGSVGAAVNYHTLSGKKYTAIRVPPVNRYGRKAQKVIASGVVTEETLKILERQALQALRDFDAGQLTIEAVLDAVLEYDELLDSDSSDEQDNVLVAHIKRRNLQRHLYQDLLEDRPWRQCDCQICQEIGIDVVIFRNSNRNRRRGFHNTYVFYKRFKSLFSVADLTGI
ncbi:MAG: tRNA-guanine transglycosylase DpdA [Snowella sp.]|nr:tRNA-guanine transglycosylase DpdA [Snowella sp.]